MSTEYPSQNGSLTQHPSGFPASTVDQYEISGLNHFQKKNGSKWKFYSIFSSLLLPVLID
ncbi:MAG: hypothetical protein DVB29_01915 [Verrucomicrobia bacterium]|nr:MAG: hypothetical protein DVB29_01915 [Verrucomicrobiota bacterium]